MSVNIDFLRQGDEYEVIELLTHVFSKWPNYETCSNKIDFWKWKYRDNPLKKEYIVVGKIEDKIVSCFHRMPYDVKIGPKIYTSSAGTDVAVHPDYRGKGLYNSMLDKLYDYGEKKGDGFFWGVTGNPILITKGKKDEYGEFPYKQFIYFKIEDFNLHLKKFKTVSLKERIGYYILKNYQDIKNYFIIKKEPNLGIKICKIDEYGSDINDFCSKIIDEYNFIFIRNKDYLNWRYCRSDIINYKNFIAIEKDEIIGYMVIKIENKDNYKTGYIIDILINGDHYNSGYELLNEAIKYFKNNGVNFVYWTIMENNLFIKIANYFGFIKSQQDIYFHYIRDHIKIGNSEAIFQTSRPEAIHFCYGDTDWA